LTPHTLVPPFVHSVAEFLLGLMFLNYCTFLSLWKQTQINWPIQNFLWLLIHAKTFLWLETFSFIFEAYFNSHNLSVPRFLINISYFYLLVCFITTLNVLLLAKADSLSTNETRVTHWNFWTEVFNWYSRTFILPKRSLRRVFRVRSEFSRPAKRIQIGHMRPNGR